MQWLWVEVNVEMFDVPVDDTAPGVMFTVLNKGWTQLPPGGFSGLTFSGVPVNGKVWANADVLANNAAAMANAMDFDMIFPLLIR